MELGGKLLVITRKHPTMKVHVLDPFCGARVTDKTLSGQLYRGELYRGEFYRGDKKSRPGDAIFGIPSGWRGLIAVQFGVVTNEESCMGWKPHNLEGCLGLNNLFTRLGVNTEFWPGVSG